MSDVNGIRGGASLRGDAPTHGDAPTRGDAVIRGNTVTRSAAAAPAAGAVDIETTPIGFSEVCLGLNLYPWQAGVMTWFEGCAGGGRVKGSVCTPNGAGKDSVLIAGLALWWVSVHLRGRVVITSRDSRQIDQQTYPALKRHEPRFEGWKFVERYVETPTGGKIILFTTDDESRCEGFHHDTLGDGRPDVDGPLLLIANEAKSIQEGIFQAFDRCTYDGLLYTSSPGLKMGRFYESHHNDYLGFRRLRVGLADCPHIPRERIDDIVGTYGADHPFTLSTLHGEFMDEDDETSFIIPPSVVRGVVEGPPEFADGRVFGFCDFAAGGDECVFACKRGNRVELVAWKEANTMASIGRFIIEFTRRGLRPGDIYGDEGGLGGPMIDRFAEAGWPINRVNNGGRALDPDRYENRGAEMWHMAGLVMRGCGCILPADSKLHAQLTTRKMKPLSDGRIGVEKKADMKKRGLSSPDRADAVVGVLAIEGEIAASAFDAEGLRALEAGVRGARLGVLARADFGVNWREDAATGWLNVWELPAYGRGYLACLKAGDAGWSVFMLRKGCADEAGRPLRDAVVARIKAPCDWDASFLVERVDLLLKWYGGPVIVPDIRNGMDVLERLRDAGASIYRRPVFDRSQAAGGGGTFVYGWETTERNVAVAVSALSRAVRERSLDLPDAVAVNDLRGYTRTDLENGDALCLGIGLQCFDAAMVYAPPRLAVPDFAGQGTWGGDSAPMGGGACR